MTRSSARPTVTPLQSTVKGAAAVEIQHVANAFPREGSALPFSFCPRAASEFDEHSKAMLVFIDESGDPGMKLGTGSSEYFVVTLVLFEDNDEALEVEKRIQDLKGELGVPQDLNFTLAS
jgi:hypothetical protein